MCVADELFLARHPGRRREAFGNKRPRGMVIQFRQRDGQNPAYSASWLNFTQAVEVRVFQSTKVEILFGLCSKLERCRLNYMVFRLS